jgi:hypothetical protein
VIRITDPASKPIKQCAEQAEVDRAPAIFPQPGPASLEGLTCFLAEDSGCDESYPERKHSSPRTVASKNVYYCFAHRTG